MQEKLENNFYPQKIVPNQYPELELLKFGKIRNSDYKSLVNSLLYNSLEIWYKFGSEKLSEIKPPFI